MKIGLIDVDGHNFPNLALMKLSAYHKAKGDEVERCNPFFRYDKVYQAKVFDFTPDFNTALQADEIVKGGTGYNLTNKLPDEVGRLMPDYGLYNIQDIAYGFLTRGCPRNCGFCIVGKKEGLKSQKVADLKDFWTGQKEIVLLDPNITASPDCGDLLTDLVRSNVKVDFTQGLDIRCMTEKKVELLNKVRVKMLHFAWDNYEFETYKKLKHFRPMFKHTGRKLTVYVLTNFNTTHEQNLERIYKLRELDYTPFVMIYDKGSEPPETRQMQRWVNNRRIWQSCKRFEDYNKKCPSDDLQMAFKQT